jgi:hypothetical protein
MSLLPGVMTIFFVWRKTADLTLSVIAASAFAALYGISQDLAIAAPESSIQSTGLMLVATTGCSCGPLPGSKASASNFLDAGNG